MKILTVVGARPQFIKAAALSRVLAARSGVTEVLAHTGQHYDEGMSDVFFEELGIPAPAHHLGVGSGPHGAQTGRMMERLEPITEHEQPDWMLVYGDTNSTLAAALVASKLHVPVAHVEAGLRSFNRAMPEEINRIVADRCANVLYAPTELAVRNLRNEGVPADAIENVGDVMFDVALHAGERAARESRILETSGLAPRGFVLATVHRAENTDTPGHLEAILDALGRLADRLPVVLPLHPRTAAVLERAPELRARAEKLRLTPPVSYLDMVQLERNAALVATDSGGVQKEAFFHGAPCVTLRAETEWVELVECGWNRLAPPPDAEAVFERLLAGLESSPDPAGRPTPYGDGNAAGRIAESLERRSRSA